MPFDMIQHLIKSVMGLSSESVGVDTIKRIVERRMEATGVKQVHDYVALVERSPEEKQNLINAVSVPETWFFRDHEPFKVLSDHVKKLRLTKSTLPIKVLSVPCSSGEEPYSIAMVMMEAGLSENQFHIDAVDISTAVIEKARLGSYGNNSFRGKENGLRDKYFQLTDDGRYQISSRIKKSVRFHNANVLDDGFMSANGPYDIVFCRNLLIYFDYETKCKVLATLHRLMCSAGLLILGHAETGRMAEGLFETLRLPGAFAYRKSDSSAQKKPTPAADSAGLNASALERE